MKKIDYIQAVFATIGGFISAKLGIAYPAFIVLLIFMILDYVTGMLASIKSGTLSSRVGVWGIVKKLCYVLIIVVAIGLDFAVIKYAEYLGFNLPIESFFGALVTLWFLFNEALSILENCLKLDVAYPAFLKSFLEKVSNAIEIKGESMKGDK